MSDAKIDKAIDVLADKITDASKSDDALKFTQAALNLAHTKATLGANKRESDK